MFFTGAILDSEDPRDYSFGNSGLAGVTAPSMSSISLVDKHIWRTQISNSCISVCIHQAIQTQGTIRYEQGRGPLLPLLGHLYGYAGARILGGQAKPGQSLPDLGSNMRLCLKWLRDHGVVSESVWPDVPENTGKLPPLDVFKAGGVTTVDKFYRIDSGEGATASLVQALRAAAVGESAPPTFVMSVGQTYITGGPAVYKGPQPNEPVSGHGQTILEWDETKRAFGVASSWGRGVGDNGIFWVSEQFMNTQTGDKWVTQVVPVVTQ